MIESQVNDKDGEHIYWLAQPLWHTKTYYTYYTNITTVNIRQMKKNNNVNILMQSQTVLSVWSYESYLLHKSATSNTWGFSSHKACFAIRRALKTVNIRDSGCKLTQSFCPQFLFIKAGESFLGCPSQLTLVRLPVHPVKNDLSQHAGSVRWSVWNWKHC